MIPNKPAFQITREPEIGDPNGRIVGLGSEKEVLRLEVTVHHVLVVQVLNSSQKDSTYISCLFLVVPFLKVRSGQVRSGDVTHKIKGSDY